VPGVRNAYFLPRFCTSGADTGHSPFFCTQGDRVSLRLGRTTSRVASAAVLVLASSARFESVKALANHIDETLDEATGIRVLLSILGG